MKKNHNLTELQVSFNRNQDATDNAILDAEAQLIAEVGPSDEYSGHWGTSDNVKLDPRLVLQTLHKDSKLGRLVSVQAGLSQEVKLSSQSHQIQMTSKPAHIS